MRCVNCDRSSSTGIIIRGEKNAYRVCNLCLKTVLFKVAKLSEGTNKQGKGVSTSILKKNMIQKEVDKKIFEVERRCQVWREQQ